MSDDPSILSHVSVGTNDLERAVAFGRAFPEFRVQRPVDGEATGRAVEGE